MRADAINHDDHAPRAYSKIHTYIHIYMYTHRSNDGVAWTMLYDQQTVLTPVNEMSAFSVSAQTSYSYIGLVVSQLAGTDQIANCLNFFQWHIFGSEVS
jgi:hypothetical protein